MGWFDEINNKLGYTKGHLTDGGKAAVGLTYASKDESSPEYNEVVYESPYTLPEVTVKAPDMRVAKAAREREDYKPMTEFMQDAIGSVGPWAPVYWGYKGGVGLKEGVPRTYNYAKNGQWGDAALSFGDNILNGLMVVPAVGKGLKVGDSLLGRLSPAYNKVRAARELASEIRENVNIASDLDKYSSASFPKADWMNAIDNAVIDNTYIERQQAKRNYIDYLKELLAQNPHSNAINERNTLSEYIGSPEWERSVSYWKDRGYGMDNVTKDAVPLMKDAISEVPVYFMKGDQIQLYKEPYDALQEALNSDFTESLAHLRKSGLKGYNRNFSDGKGMIVTDRGSTIHELSHASERKLHDDTGYRDIPFFKNTPYEDARKMVMSKNKSHEDGNYIGRIKLSKGANPISKRMDYLTADTEQRARAIDAKLQMMRDGIDPSNRLQSFKYILDHINDNSAIKDLARTYGDDVAALNDLIRNAFSYSAPVGLGGIGLYNSNNKKE